MMINKQIMEKMYIQPKVETMVLTVGNLMTPGGGSPTGGDVDPRTAPARDPQIF